MRRVHVQTEVRITWPSLSRSRRRHPAARARVRPTVRHVYGTVADRRAITPRHGTIVTKPRVTRRRSSPTARAFPVTTPASNTRPHALQSSAARTRTRPSGRGASGGLDLRSKSSVGETVTFESRGRTSTPAETLTAAQPPQSISSNSIAGRDFTSIMLLLPRSLQNTVDSLA